MLSFFSWKNWNLHTWTYAHFNHVILIECTYRFGGWVIGLCSVLQQTNRFLLALGIGNEGKTGCLTFHFFSTPTLWEKMNFKMIGCRHATAVSIENYRFWSEKSKLEFELLKTGAPNSILLHKPTMYITTSSLRIYSELILLSSSIRQFGCFRNVRLLFFEPESNTFLWLGVLLSR